MVTHVIALDPSGNFNEGKGTTGWVLLQLPDKLIASGTIKATKYKCQEDFWNAHVELLKQTINKYKKNLMVVIEDYILYKSRTENQINSQFETCRLIGLLQWYCWKRHQKVLLETASQVKQRWSDYVLCERGYLYEAGNRYYHTHTKQLIENHTRDALRHALHYSYCKHNKPNKPKKKQKIERYSNYGHTKRNAGRRS